MVAPPIPTLRSDGCRTFLPPRRESPSLGRRGRQTSRAYIQRSMPNAPFDLESDGNKRNPLPDMNRTKLENGMGEERVNGHENGIHLNGHGSTAANGCFSKKRMNGHTNGHANGFSNGHVAEENGFCPKKSPPRAENAHDEADEQSSYTFEIVDQVAHFLLEKTTIRPNVGIICGSGLGSIVDALTDKTIFPYEDIPHFPVSSVAGHAGQLVFGRLEGVPVICMQGRFHYYEGYPLWKCCMPVRVMKLLGIKTFIATNAAGGLNEKFKVGDIMLIKDHVNLMGFAGNNPLRGANDDRFGPRFPAMSKAYDPELRKIAKNIAEDMNIKNILREGVYTCVGGPCFETVAELRLLKILGIDAVGMSTVHEVVTAVHCGLRCFAFSLITNQCVTDYENEAEANHQEVMDTGKTQTKILQRLIQEFVKAVGEK